MTLVDVLLGVLAVIAGSIAAVAGFGIGNRRLQRTSDTASRTAA
jgi:hypothetical protein